MQSLLIELAGKPDHAWLETAKVLKAFDLDRGGREKLAGRGRLLEEKAIPAWLLKSRTGVSNE